MNASNLNNKNEKVTNQVANHIATNETKSNSIEIPSISLPKGGGAIKGIDEKFKVNPANGTASFSIPIPFSKTRSGFSPHLALSYNSGTGNSPFGLGWGIDLPSIHRRTEKLLPQYFDAEESDVFQFSGFEDLVPSYIQNEDNWVLDSFTTTIDNITMIVKRYKPRIEGSFARIEKINLSDNTCYWKTTTKDNIITYFGVSPHSRIADPIDNTRIFKWLPDFSFDDKGNCFSYNYVFEDTKNVLSVLNEKNRLMNPLPFSNTYLKNIQYGNVTPFNPKNNYSPVGNDNISYMFEMVVDYGDHNPTNPSTIPDNTWGCRLDPYSDYRSGFEIRTYRLCRKILLFHNFKKLDSNPVVVKSIEFAYQNYNFQPPLDPGNLKFIEAELVTGITEVSWQKDSPTTYKTKSLPTIGFTYNIPVWNNVVENVSLDNLVNSPIGLGNNYQFTDLWSEGISGILTEQSEGWYYKSNLGNGNFTSASTISPKPSFVGLSNGSLQLQALEADGRKFIVNTSPPMQGYFELSSNGKWFPYTPFAQYPIIDIHDPNVKFIDLNGDGMPDLIISEEQIFTWYPSMGTLGYDSAEIAPKPFDEEKGPAIVFSDPVQSIFLSDMSGDGLTDIVRIRNGEICYWPNLGYGKFGAKVNMTNAPVFDLPDMFNPSYLHLADINGTGATDIIYLGQNKFKAWLNLSGNAWGNPIEWDNFPSTSSINQFSVVDLLGNGTACLVWSSSLPQNTSTPMRYIDLMGGNKPYLMTGYDSGMGKTVNITYKPSTYFYLQDKLAGTSWITKLPFPVHCVQNTIINDVVSETSYSNSYTYHHGYYDNIEREFRGFGRVEQIDIDNFDINISNSFDQPPVLTKTWFHTGSYFGVDRILNQFSEEYFQNTLFKEYQLPQPILPPGLSDIELREALRACKGMVLRQEIYALDAMQNPSLAAFPYNVTEHNCLINLIQPLLDNRYTVFLNTESEAISYQYERNPSDPRILHTLNTSIDPRYGFILNSFSVMYGRQPVSNLSRPGGVLIPGNQQLPAVVLQEQQKMHITFSEFKYTVELVDQNTYLLPIQCESKNSEATGIVPQNQYFSVSELLNYIDSSATSTLRLRALKQHRIIYCKNDLVTPLPFGTMGTLAIPYQTYHLAFNTSVLSIYGSLVTDQALRKGNYIKSDDYINQGLFPADDNRGEWWLPSGRINYLNTRGVFQPFYLPFQYIDVFNNATTISYDNNWLCIIQTEDPISNKTIAEYDYRVLAPQKVIDINNNITEVSFDVHGLVAGIALEGKGDGAEGDNLIGFDPNADPTLFFNDPYSNDLTGGAAALIGNATSRFVYDYSVIPVRTGSIIRENHLNHFTDPRLNIDPTKFRFSFEYTDGLGRSAMKKIQADNYPISSISSKNAICDEDSNTCRWIGTGKTVYNNKGKAVKQYEPFFSNTNNYEEAPANGVTPIMYYDSIGRLIKTDFPDGTFLQVEFNPWMEISYDQNDNILQSNWYKHRTDPTNPLSSDPWQMDAANKAAVHNTTPTIKHLDSLGRPFYTVALNKLNLIDSCQGLSTYSILDIEGNVLQVIDARQNAVMQYAYDLLNRIIQQVSKESGTKFILNDATDKPYYKWDNNNGANITFYVDYDALRRPLHNYVTIGNAAQTLVEYIIYGENISINGSYDVTNNLRGKIYQHFDSGGLLTFYQYDFKGNLLQGSRRFTSLYKPTLPNDVMQAVVWSGTPSNDFSLLESNKYISLSQYDALNRSIFSIRPFSIIAPAAIIPTPYTETNINNADIIINSYGVSGNLSTVDVYPSGGTTASNYVSKICHNEKGQRLCIQYGNNTTTKYSYDPLTFRLIRLRTTRSINSQTMQDITYYYDPVGNITHEVDAAQQALYFNNKIVNPDSDFTYDAIYRLALAQGREHIGQGLTPSYNDFNRVQNAQPGDGNQMQTYTQTYQYDDVGNMLQMANRGSWKRTYTYDTSTNKLLTSNPNDTNAGSITYAYDTHGNMLNMAQLNSVDWNYKDELQHVNLLGGGDAYYMYDFSGQRIRKVWEKSSGTTCERRYLGGYEIYIEYSNTGNGTSNTGNPTIQRDSLHIMDDKSRIALIDNLITGNDGDVPYLPRYQYGNHLGSAMLELDNKANIISYEEYYPFGSTSYQAVDTTREIPKKRYRYTGMERDEESGLEYHSARYYAPWLARWTAADPIGIKDGVNVYSYCSNNPINKTDSSGHEGQICNGVYNTETATCSVEISPTQSIPQDSNSQSSTDQESEPETVSWLTEKTRFGTLQQSVQYEFDPNVSSNRNNFISWYEKLSSQLPELYSGSIYPNVLPPSNTESNYNAAALYTAQDSINNRTRWALQTSLLQYGIRHGYDQLTERVANSTEFSYQIHETAFKFSNDVETIWHFPWTVLTQYDFPKIGELVGNIWYGPQAFWAVVNMASDVPSHQELYDVNSALQNTYTSIMSQKYSLGGRFINWTIETTNSPHGFQALPLLGKGLRILLDTISVLALPDDRGADLLQTFLSNQKQ